MKTFRHAATIIVAALFASISTAQTAQLKGTVSVAGYGGESTASKVSLISGDRFPVSMIGQQIVIAGNPYTVTAVIDGGRLIIYAHFSLREVPYSAVLPMSNLSRRLPSWMREMVAGK